MRATDEQLQKCKECGHQQEEVMYKIFKKWTCTLHVYPIKTFQANRGVDQSSQHVNMNTTTSTNTSFDSSKVSVCDMCSNYEAQLVKEQKRTSELEAKVHSAEKAAERHKEELLKEIGFRKDMEEKWNEKKEEHKQQVIIYLFSYRTNKLTGSSRINIILVGGNWLFECLSNWGKQIQQRFVLFNDHPDSHYTFHVLQVAELTRATECTEQDLKELRQYFNQSCSEMKMNLGRLTHEREMIHQELEK